MSSRRTGLITDSTCDIPDELVDKYGIVIVPLYVIWGNEVVKDRVEMAAEDFYRRVESGSVHPTTSQATSMDFTAAYEAVARAGAEEIVVITISAAMSGTFNAAKQAAETVSLPVYCVDAKGPTMTLGWQVLAAARARESGGDAQAMIRAADEARASMVQYVCLDTLEYLYLGGRIGGAARFIGTLLNVKPLIYIDHEKGIVEGGDRIRGRKRSLEALYRRFFADLDTSKKARIAVLHGNALEDAERLAHRIQEEYSPVELLVGTTTPVLGVHTGPRAVALCGYAED